MKKINLLFLALLCIFSVFSIGSSCNKKNDQERFGYIDDDEFRRSLILAVEGDPAASERISKYFLHFKRDARLGFFWQERAAILGSTNAQSQIKSFFETSNIENYRQILGRTNSIAEGTLFEVLKMQNP